MIQVQSRPEAVGVPLTGPDGEFYIDEALRQHVCYLDDGTLLVSKSHQYSAHVKAFMARLNHHGRTYQVHLVDLATIERTYANARQSAKGRSNASSMQMSAKDLFTHAVSEEASDIHVRVSKHDKTHIWYRANGDLTFQQEHSEEYGEQLCTTIYQSLADVSDATFEKLSRQDARIAAKSKIPSGLDGIRIATSPQVDGFLMVLRLLYDSSGETNDLGELGYNLLQKEVMELLKRRPTGINILSGPTGSGKSTTLKRVLSAIIAESAGRKHVITVEDPPEYRIIGAVQTPVTNADTEEERARKFQQAIKAAMRLDPDVMMIGEMRDKPSASLAVQAAMTGHQVWSTVHANSAFAIINRLIDLGMAPNLVTDPTIITGLACQRLIKRLCPHCKQPLGKNLDRYNRRDLDRIMGLLPLDSTFVRGPGCDHCRETGNKGRTVVAEVVETNETLMKLLRESSRQDAMAYWKESLDGISMIDHAIEKIREGHADPFQVEEVVGVLNTRVAM